MSVSINNLQSAEVQDSNYTDTGLVNARYNGSVARPTFNPSELDLFNSEKGDYPILKLIPVEGVIFEVDFPDHSIEELIKNPIKVDQFELKIIYIATFSRETNKQGLRQVERDRLSISLELPLSGINGPGPAVQTFVFEEVEGRIKRIPTKKIFFVQQNKFGATDSVGKLQGTSIKDAIPSANNNFTRVFITTSGSLSAEGACRIRGPAAIEKFLIKGITSLDPISIIGKVLFSSSSLVIGSEEFNGENKFFGISFTQNDSPTTSVFVNATGSILEAESCSNFNFGDFKEPNP